MKLLPLLPVLYCLSLVQGTPVAEADADAQYGQNNYGAMPNQMGGPGYGSGYQGYDGNDMNPNEADNMEGYGTLQIPDSGNVVPLDSESTDPGYNPNYMQQPTNMGYQQGNPGQYVRPMNYGFQPGNMDKYARSADYPYMNPPISSYNPSPPISSPNYNNPVSTYPLMPIYPNRRPSYNNYQPLNSQGQMFTRSYTPIQGSPCSSVCRSRPMINSRPLCNTACNIKPSCSMNKPQVDYAVQGQTTFCKPKPVVTSMGCSSSSGCSGYNPGYGSGYNPGFVSGGSGYNPGFVSGGSGYNPGVVTGGSGYNPGVVTGGSGYNPGVVTGGSGYNPGVVTGGSGYNPGLPCGGSSCGSPCSGSTCSGGSGYNPGVITGGSDYNPGYVNGGYGFNPGFNGGSGFNPGFNGYFMNQQANNGDSFVCNSEGCTKANSAPQQAVNLPGKVGSWSDGKTAAEADVEGSSP